MRYAIVAKDNREGLVEFSEDANRSAFKFGSEQREVPPTELGSAVWDGMKKAGVDPLTQNHFMVHENDRSGTLVFMTLPVMEGARVVWLVLYRVDRDASCFKPLGSRQRIADALDLAFARLAEEIKLPHKP